MPTDFCDQLREARQILLWLVGDTDEIPVDDDNRGRFIGARDPLEWVLGGRSTSPLGLQVAGLPTCHDLEHEDLQADDVVSQGRPVGVAVDTDAYPPPQYGEAIQASIRWLRGEATSSPIDSAGYGL